MQKRGQVTIFVIIGIIILVSALLYFVVSEFILKGEFESLLEKNKNIPNTIQPVKSYLDTCVKQITTEGINILASQGGYIVLPESQVQTTEFTPLGSTLQIFKNSNFKTSVWFREESNGVQKLSAPTTSDIERELENYINLNFQSCINGLDQFSNDGFLIISSSKISSKVNILSDKIEVVVNSPIQVSKETVSLNLEDHLASVPSSLGELHSISLEILNKENTQFFIENKTIDTLIAYDPLIPFSGVSTHCTPRTWSKTEVINKIKNTLSENIAAFRIKGTNYLSNEDKFDYLTFDALKESHKSVSVNFMYSKDFPTVIEVTPSQGDILKEDSLNENALPGVSSLTSAFFCLSTHNFVYTMKYPILVTLTGNDGLTFQFATQIIIIRNQARMNRNEVENVEEINNELCKYSNKDLTIETYTTDNTGDLKPLSDVKLNFKCSPVVCPLNLKKLSENRYSTKVPVCFNGIITAEKEGYYNGKTLEVSSNEEINEVIPVTLIPFFKKKVKVFIVDKATGETRSPYNSEQVIFQLTNNDRTTPYSTTFVYPSDQKSITLIPGNYSFTSFVIGNSTWPVTTPKQVTQHCFDSGALLGFFGAETKCVTTEIPETKMYSVMKGGADFNFVFTQEDLAKSNDLALYTLAYPIPATMEQMGNISLQIATNSEDPLFRYPEL